MFIFCRLFFPSIGSRTWALGPELKIDQVDLTDWKFFLPSNLKEEIIPNPKTFSADT